MKPHQKGAKSERNYIKKMKSYQKERNHIKKGTKPPFFMVLEPTLLNRLSWNRPFRLSCSVRLKNRTGVRLRNRLRVARFGTFSIPNGKPSLTKVRRDCGRYLLLLYGKPFQTKVCQHTDI